MCSIKVCSVDEKVDEVQIWYVSDDTKESSLVGAGAWTKPYDKQQAANVIVATWVGLDKVKED